MEILRISQKIKSKIPQALYYKRLSSSKIPKEIWKTIHWTLNLNQTRVKENPNNSKKHLHITVACPTNKK